MPAEAKVGKGNFIIKQPLAFIIHDGIEHGDGGIGLFKEFLKKNYF